MKERALAMKEKVRQTILDSTASCDMIHKLELVDTLQRIGLDYHYKTEIHELLRHVYDDSDGGYDDLYVTSLRFYLLRKHGYTVSSDVFQRFRDEKGNVSSDDLDYNILQALYCEELKELTIWWKDFQSQTDLSFARDRLVELHFWMLGVLYESCYSYPQIMMTKFTVIASVFDDLYDNCSTTEEGDIFIGAIERWEEQTQEQLPAHLKAILVNILNTTNKIEEDLKLQENKHAEMVKKMVINTAKFYHAEVKWRDEHYVPATVEEHLQTSVRSSVCMQITTMSFISLGNVTSREAVEWAFTFPKLIRGVCMVGRIGNDIVSHEREQESEHVVSTVQTCMKQYGVTVDEANDKLRVIIEEAWMDIVEQYLDQKYPIALLEKAVNVAQTMDFMYKHEDAYTLSFSLKDVIASMYVNPCELA
ncbi:hypothetical protein QOZ80_8BG0644380 [Eleusine coracana subsp. coracana]|nr:hypothetical protein QOZ80_8BG0644380 [Eleusine coracana subsp. coracana]